MDALAAVLLRHLGRVYLPPANDHPVDQGWIDAVETDFIDRGWILGADTRFALGALDQSHRVMWADWILAMIEEVAGGGISHIPLFRQFPNTIPTNTTRLFVERVIAATLQEPEQPCVLCGTMGSVMPVSPCAHLVCVVCFDGSNYSGCPVCHRRIDPSSPFLQNPSNHLRATQFQYGCVASLLARMPSMTRPN